MLFNRRKAAGPLAQFLEGLGSVFAAIKPANVNGISRQDRVPRILMPPWNGTVKDDKKWLISETADSLDDIETIIQFSNVESIRHG